MGVMNPLKRTSSCRRRFALLSSLVFAAFASLAGAAQTQSGFARANAVSAHAVNTNFITVDQLRLRYVESGNGPAVVMLHGNAGSVEDFNFGAVDALSANYHVIAIDRPGHGLSERPGNHAATLEYQARVLHDVMGSLRIQQPVLMGHSWGAALALCYALQYPKEISGLILVAPAAYPGRGENRLLRAVAKTPLLGDAALIAGKTTLGKHMLRSELERAFYPQPLPPEYLESVAAPWLGRKHLRAYLEDEANLNGSLRRWSERYSQINVPVVIITGDHDQIVSSKDNAYRLHAVVPNSRLIALKGMGHEIPQCDPKSIYVAARLITESNGDGNVYAR